MKRTTARRAGALLLLLTLTACGGSSDDTYADDPAVEESEYVEEAPPAPSRPPANVEVVNDWAEVPSSYYGTSYFRVIRINGQCYVEQMDQPLAPGGAACEQ